MLLHFTLPAHPSPLDQHLPIKQLFLLPFLHQNLFYTHLCHPGLDALKKDPLIVEHIFIFYYFHSIL